MTLHTDRAQPEQVATALLISKHESDHFYFERLFSRTNWKLYHARNSAEAIALFKQRSIPVVIADEALDHEEWGALLQALAQAKEVPKLLVASLLTPGAVFAEVLDSRAYDILARPLDQQEVLHSISMAWLAWKCDQGAGARPQFSSIFGHRSAL